MLKALVDSGAGECVCGPAHFGAFQALTDPSRPNAGVENVCADGGRIHNVGEKSVKSLSDDGVKLNVTFQVAAVDRPLISVAKLTAAGHRVRFEPDHATIVNIASGRKTHVEKKNGVYVLRMWVPAAAQLSEPSSSGGTRQ